MKPFLLHIISDKVAFIFRNKGDSDFKSIFVAMDTKDTFNLYQKLLGILWLSIYDSTLLPSYRDKCYISLILCIWNLKIYSIGNEKLETNLAVWIDLWDVWYAEKLMWLELCYILSFGSKNWQKTQKMPFFDLFWTFIFKWANGECLKIWTNVQIEWEYCAF